MRFLPAGDSALLIELDDLAAALALLDGLAAAPIAGVTEVVPAAQTLLVSVDRTVTSVAAVRAAIAAVPVAGERAVSDTLVTIPVHYDGADLAEVAEILGITVDELIARHTGTDYTVAFTGFAPGFAYLVGGHPSLDVPRRAVPRTRLPAGAVGLAGTFSGVYPKASPGGWQIIGQTNERMWDLGRDVPALLQPGFRARFEDAGAHAAVDPIPVTVAAPVLSVPAIEVVSPGLQAIVEDAGRPGLAAQGVSAAGAVDRGALRTANRIVGNAPDTAGIEALWGGLSLRSHGDTVIAVTGAECDVTVASGDLERTFSTYEAIALRDGDVLTLGAAARGLRGYVAVRGGLDIPEVLGSRSRDTLAELGPEPLAGGDRFAVLPVAAGTPAVLLGETAPRTLPTANELVTLRVVPGPRLDWFTADAVRTFTEQEWTVTPNSNRVGVRLTGATALERAITTELPSEGTAVGAIQVPASGEPVIFLADHPLTGGYPVIGVLADADLDLAAQLPIGTRLRFTLLPSAA